jgi:hypothetical protein
MAIRASSCVSLSSFFSASSKSALPISVFKYFSEHHSVMGDTHTKLLTHSALLYLLGCNPKNRENFHHYLNDCIYHFRG